MRRLWNLIKCNRRLSINNKVSRGPDGIPNKLLKRVGPVFTRALTVLLNQMSNCGFAVKIYGFVSRIFRAVIGLPQGSALAPALFTFYIHDVPKPEFNMKAYGFADDMLVIAWGEQLQSQRRIQAFLFKLQQFYARNGLSVNVEKSQAVTITGTSNRLTRRSREKCKEIQLTMNGIPIPKTKSLKYLGIQFNEKFSFVENTKEAVGKMCNTMGAMKRVLYRQELLTSDSKLAFFKAAIRQVLAYGFPVWSCVSSHQMETARRAEGKFIRWTRADRGRRDDKYLNSSLLYADAKLRRIDAWMVELYLKSFAKFEESENGWVRDMCTPDSKARAMAEEKYHGPERLFHVNTVQPLFNENGKIFHYYQRIRDGG